MMLSKKRLQDDEDGLSRVSPRGACSSAAPDHARKQPGQAISVLTPG